VQQGGVSGSIAKTATAPIERVKLLIQTQDANPKVRVEQLLDRPKFSFSFFRPLTLAAAAPRRPRSWHGIHEECV
jgi:hypothetical protein